MPDLPPHGLGRAELEPHAGRAPRSRQFNDTYYDAEDGLNESRYVFLDGCHMRQMWQQRASFVIGELGFGTGLNFLVTWNAWRQAWKNDHEKPTRLHFISVEGFPLTRDQIEDALATWPELASLSEQLLNAYADAQPGFHRLTFESGHVVLTLLLGPALPMLENLDATVDAWFLDGFAPDRNTDMWHPDVLGHVARLSRTNTRLASFTVAGQVRRDLEAAGFQLEKRSGWGKKREVLAGTYTGPSSEPVLEPWYRPPAGRPQQPCDVAIIGGGLAGAATAHAFNLRGCKTTVIDAGNEIASGASATPAAILMPRLTADHSIDGQFYATAWRACLALLDKVQADGFNIDRQVCGSLRLAESEAETRRQKAIVETGPLPDSLLSRLSATDTSEIAGLPITFGSLFFPQGGTLSPQRLCAALMKDTRVILNMRCADLRLEDARWQVLDDDGHLIANADIVILANGLASGSFQQAQWLPISARLGQVTRVASTEASAALKCVIAGEGYLTPPLSGEHVVGATFDHVSDADLAKGVPMPTEDADDRNLSVMRRLLPGTLDDITADGLNSWTGLRCTTPDHLPLAGPLPDYDAYTNDFAELRHGHRWSHYPNARYHQGLGVLTGLGAHGVITAPLAAELLASQMLGEPCPLPRDVANGLHPGRFIVRDLKRRLKRHLP